jgi:hypothetical protein
MAKAKATVDLGIDIKLAGGKKSKADKPEQLSIDSKKIDVQIQKLDEKSGKPEFVKENGEWVPATKQVSMFLVDHCIGIKQKIESLVTEVRLHEQQLIEDARAAKDEEAKTDNFVKTVNVQGTALKIQIQFKDSYSAMDPTMELPLRKVFADKFDLMWNKSTNYSLNTAKVAELKVLLGDKFDLFVNTDVSITPAENFQQTYFALRKTIKADQKEVVEKVCAATQAKPAVKYPK